MKTIRKRWALFVRTDRGAWEAVESFHALPYHADLAARLVGLDWRVEEIEPEAIPPPNVKDVPCREMARDVRTHGAWQLPELAQSPC